MGYDVDRPWRDLPEKDRSWILFTVRRHGAGLCRADARTDPHRPQPPDGAQLSGHLHRRARYMLDTFANTKSADEAARLA